MLQPPSAFLAKSLRKFNSKIQAFERGLNLFHSCNIRGVIYSPTFLPKILAFCKKKINKFDKKWNIEIRAS